MNLKLLNFLLSFLGHGASQRAFDNQVAAGPRADILSDFIGIVSGPNCIADDVGQLPRE
jgi:hypothetical protein